MSADDYKNLHPIFTPLNDQETVEFFNLMTIKDYTVGQTIIESGTPGTAIGVVLEGVVKVTIPIGVDKDPRHLADVHPGYFIGELAYFGNCDRTADVTATVDTKIGVIERGTLGAYLKENPSTGLKINHTMLGEVARRLMEANYSRVIENERRQAEVKELEARLQSSS